MASCGVRVRFSCYDGVENVTRAGELGSGARQESGSRRLARWSVGGVYDPGELTIHERISRTPDCVFLGGPLLRGVAQTRLVLAHDGAHDRLVALCWPVVPVL